MTANEKIGRRIAAARKARKMTQEQLGEKLDVSFVLDTLEFMHKGGRCSGIAALGAFADKLEKACVQTIESGVMTKDLSLLWEKGEAQVKTSEEFLAAIRENLDKLM